MSKLPIHKLPGAGSLTGIALLNGATAATALKINRAAVTNPGVGNDSSQGYAAMSLWLNTLTNHVFVASTVGVGTATWTDITAGGANGITRETITVANAFSAGDVVRRTAGGYALAQADSAANANVLGIIETASGADFTIVYMGKITLTAHGFTIGTAVYLDPASAGDLTATQPVTVSQIDRQMGVVLDANTIVVMDARGNVVPAAAGTVTSVDATGGAEVAAGAPITATGTIRGAMVVNAQTGTTYVVLTGDRGKLVTATNSSPIAVTVPTAGSGAGFPSGWYCDFQNRGAGTATLTPVSGTIDGAASLALTTGQGLTLVTDGTNWFTQRGGAAVVPGALPTGFTSSAQTITAAGALTLAHGLAVKPRLVQLRLKCISAEKNYSVNDEIFFAPMACGASGDNLGISIVPDATNLNIRYGSQTNVFVIVDKTTGQSGTGDLTKWNVIFDAWK